MQYYSVIVNDVFLDEDGNAMERFTVVLRSTNKEFLSIYKVTTRNRQGHFHLVRDKGWTTPSTISSYQYPKFVLPP